MRKLIGLILTCFTLAFIASACGGDSYAKRLKNERKSIANFINKKGFTVINAYPQDGFREGEYFQDPETGIYLHVIDSGVGKRARPYILGKQSGTIVSMRFDSTGYLNDSIQNLTNMLSFTPPMQLTYGYTQTYTSGDPSYFQFLSPACAFPLQYVGDSAEVSIIIPFLMGSLDQSNRRNEAMYFGKLKYVFIK